ncbi:MAG: hypothetical protein NTY38_07320 [Acidobacteria bacterium]|nr:hypothetical protein [Acidobacteriota bacterium]
MIPDEAFRIGRAAAEGAHTNISSVALGSAGKADGVTLFVDDHRPVVAVAALVNWVVDPLLGAIIWRQTENVVGIAFRGAFARGGVKTEVAPDLPIWTEKGLSAYGALDPRLTVGGPGLQFLATVLAKRFQLTNLVPYLLQQNVLLWLQCLKLKVIAEEVQNHVHRANHDVLQGFAGVRQLKVLKPVAPVEQVIEPPKITLGYLDGFVFAKPFEADIPTAAKEIAGFKLMPICPVRLGEKQSPIALTQPFLEDELNSARNVQHRILDCGRTSIGGEFTKPAGYKIQAVCEER